MAALRRVIAIVRQSKAKDGSVSPEDQRRRIADYCEREGLAIVQWIEELDVSGGTPLAKRAGLRAAVEAIEAGQADGIVVAYFDRLVRSLNVQAEVVERVERAGGVVAAVDVGAVSNGSAGQWLSGTMLGMVAEYHRRATAERVRSAVVESVANGIPPYPVIPAGLRQRPDRTLEHDPATVEAVREAFRMRAARPAASVRVVREYLADQGIDLTLAGVRAMLKSRLMVGELRFGDLVNPDAVAPIVDEATWRRAQAAQATRGRLGKSDRLLARLGVLRCQACDGRMVVSHAGRGGTYATYTCQAEGCPARYQAIGAGIVEGVVWSAVKDLVQGIEGRASDDGSLAAAKVAMDAAAVALDNAVRAFAGLGDVESAREVLAELKADADAKADEYHALASRVGATRVVTAADLDEAASMDRRRELVAALIARVTVAPGGRGQGRVKVVPVAT